MFFERVVHAGRHRVEAERMAEVAAAAVGGNGEGGRMSLFRALIITRQIAEAVCVCVCVCSMSERQKRGVRTCKPAL